MHVLILRTFEPLYKFQLQHTWNGIRREEKVLVDPQDTCRSCNVKRIVVIPMEDVVGCKWAPVRL